MLETFGYLRHVQLMNRRSRVLSEEEKLQRELALFDADDLFLECYKNMIRVWPQMALKIAIEEALYVR
jgi:hypothetical protein